MVGFVSALSASLAIIILVALSALISYIQSILPEKGLIKIDENTYRYIQEEVYSSEDVLKDIILQLELLSLTPRLKSYQAGCSYGFNVNDRTAIETATYNYLMLNQYFSATIKIDAIKSFSENNQINTCFVDINLYPEEKTNG